MKAYYYKVKTSVNSKIVTIDNINQEEFEDFRNNEYLSQFDNLIIERNDNKVVEYYKEENYFIVTNKFKRV